MNTSTVRQQAFQQLKSPCVQLLQIAARLPQIPSLKPDLLQALAALLEVLTLNAAHPDLLDAKLAEYSFVPISQVLRASRLVPVRALELCLQCISVLLCTGWRQNLDPNLSGQLLILFTFLAKPTSVENGIAATSEELQALAFSSMGDLFTSISKSSSGKQAITATANMPTLGDALLTLLNGLTDSKSNEVKLQAVIALGILQDTIIDDDALASFLPRIVSSLTKILTPSSSTHVKFRVLQSSLTSLRSVITRVLSDQATKDLARKPSRGESDSDVTIIRSLSWLDATASQIKLALANVFKLRDHDKTQVQEALVGLCICIIRDCYVSLSNCTTMALEVLMSVVDPKDSQIDGGADLKLIVSTNQGIADLLKECLYGWIVSLPSIIQSRDEYSRRRVVHQVSLAVQLLDAASILLDEKLMNSFQDGVSAIMSDSKEFEELTQNTSHIAISQVVEIRATKHLTFEPIKFRSKGQQDAMSDFVNLVQELARSGAALQLAQNAIASVSTGTLETRLASFWLSVNLIRSVHTRSSIFDDFVEADEPVQQHLLLDDLYSHSVDVLTHISTTSDQPWQIYALSLETIAMQAARYGPAFRPELSEVLYPVLHQFGGGNPDIRSHAFTCLTLLSRACDYKSAGELIIANADYIVNAVGLKLAFGDISPQAPQVLLTMMRLCGPSLVPFLDDLLGSIFQALEQYHGYPRLVELLFSVLKGIAEESVKAPQLSLAETDKIEKSSQRPKMLRSRQVVEAIEALNTASRKRRDNDKNRFHDGEFPREAWGDVHAEYSEDLNELTSNNDSEQAVATRSGDSAVSALPVFNTILKISELTQHYLPHASPDLRASLLSLLITVVPSISKDEDSFLPLINTLWPVILARLKDSEAYVLSKALDTIACICMYAGNFTSGRVDDAWELIRSTRPQSIDIQQQIHMSDVVPATSRTTTGVRLDMTGLMMSRATENNIYEKHHYVDAPSRMIWKSFVSLMCIIARHVTIKEERFEEMIDLLDPVLENHVVLDALQRCNDDVIWLRMYKKHKQHNDSEMSTKRKTRPIKTPQSTTSWAFAAV